MKTAYTHLHARSQTDMRLFLTVLTLLPLLFLFTGCSNDEPTNCFQHMQIAEPLTIHPDWDGAVSMAILDIQRTGYHNARRLYVAVENSTGSWLWSDNSFDHLEFFDGEHWHTIPKIGGIFPSGRSFPPYGGDSSFGEPFTVLLSPRSYGFDGIDGPGLTDFWLGLFRLRHRVWADSAYGRIPHEIVAEFTIK